MQTQKPGLFGAWQIVARRLRRFLFGEQKMNFTDEDRKYVMHIDLGIEESIGVIGYFIPPYRDKDGNFCIIRPPSPEIISPQEYKRRQKEAKALEGQYIPPPKWPKFDQDWISRMMGNDVHFPIKKVKPL